MGIKGLTRLIADQQAEAGQVVIKEREMKHYFARKVAVDASMCLYQFLIAMRQGTDLLTDGDGNTTAHLVGLFYRTIRMVENSIKPVYVFDGKPPDLKSGEIVKRKEKAQAAEEALKEALKEGDQDLQDKFGKRTVRATRQQNEEAKRLLRLMGMPVVEAPSEAEAQCAVLAQAGQVWGTASEDVDALTFGTTVLLRHMFHSGKDVPVLELTLETILSLLKLNQTEFIDLCILCGCDYADTIRGIGPKKALKLIQDHRSIEAVLKALDSEKYPAPENWMYKEARQFFIAPEVMPGSEVQLAWTEPDEQGLISFL